VRIHLDSSVVLRLLFADGVPLGGRDDWETAFASQLLSVEVRRAIDRQRLLGAVTDEGVAAFLSAVRVIESRIVRVAVTGALMRSAAAPMRVPLRTLDALHLATAVFVRNEFAPDLVFATHDRQLAIAARALEFDVGGADA
jgi:predicted nucleic acid-binding protein